MKTAACIALLALAASACSRTDNTQTPDDMTTRGTEAATMSTPRTQMPLETAAPNESSTPFAKGAVAPHGAPAHGNAQAPNNGASGNGVTDGSATVFNPEAGPTAANPTPAYPEPAIGVPSRPDADNTRVNARDRGPSVTPMDQGNNDTDLKITQRIRQRVMGDEGLSFTAKNVKIITNKGTVVLRGPVKSDDERARIDSAAKTVAGDSNVINELEIKK